MSYGRSKTDNEYARVVFDVDAPKTVWMALAVSFAHRLELAHMEPHGMARVMMDEWATLNANGIVPQKPRKGR